MKKIILAIIVLVAIFGSMLFLSPYSEKILGTENFADDIMAFIFEFTNESNFKPNHTCVFDKQDTDSKYRASVANCTDPAKYYYSCECGAKGTEKFEYGEAKGHNNVLLIQGDYKNSYLVGETFDATGMIASVYCPDCESSKEVENLNIPETEPFTDSIEHQTITVTAEGLSANVSYRAMQYAMTKVELVADEATGKVYYVVHGRYAEGFDTSSLFFSLTCPDKLYWSNTKTSDKLNVEVNETERTFKMSLDVTETATEQNYTPYYYGNKTKGTNPITDYTGKYDGTELTVGNFTYTLIHKTNPDNMSAYGVPILYKTLNLFGPSYKASSVKLELDEANGKVYYVVSGTSLGYTMANELKTDILMKFRNSGGTFLTHDHIEVFEYNEENGNYTFKIDVAGLEVKKNPYYTRFGEKDRTGAVPDFKGLSKSKVDTTPVIYDGKVYAIVYGGSSAADGYGTISVKVSVDDKSKFIATSINLELDETAGKIFYVVSGTSEGYESLEKFAADINFSLGNATESKLTVTAFDAATGNFTFKVDVTGVAVMSKSQITKLGRQIDDLANLDYISLENVDTATMITFNDRQYQLFYVPGGDTEATGYGAVGLKVANASQIATSAYLKLEDNKVYYVIEGVTLKYDSQEAFVADFTIQIRNKTGNASSKVHLNQNNISSVSFDVSTGVFTIKIEITNLETNTNPYYTRIGNAAGTSDFNYLDTSAVNTDTITLNGKTYTMMYVPGSTERADAYGTVGFKIANAQ